LKCKGVDSVRSHVANLQDFNKKITHELFCEELIKAYHKKQNIRKCEIYEISESQMKENLEIKEIYNRMNTWEWKFGETPEFEYIKIRNFAYSIKDNFQWGNLEIFKFSTRKKIGKY